MLKSLALSFIALLISQNGYALKSTDLDLFDYEVRFTNPDCPTYRYDSPMFNFVGERLVTKPQSYCLQKDGRRAARANHSPIKKVLSWVNSAYTKDITVLTFSLSNRSFISALCRAQGRGVDVRVVMDRGTDPAKSAATKARLENCKNSYGRGIYVTYRGGSGGFGIHHNKLLAINARDASLPLQLAYGSANFSSGLVLHHENWSFVTVQKASYFAQNHLCMIDGIFEHGRDKRAFSSYLKSCKRNIPYEKESDITLYVAPIEGKAAMGELLKKMNSAHVIDLAAHRFSNRDLIGGLFDHIRKKGPLALRMFFDDDMFWSAQDGRGFGNQDSNEARIMRSFLDAGVRPHYAQTEHREHLLHHNKFVLTRNSRGYPTALHTGAGNLTNSGFYRNFENFYHITRPDVLHAFAQQYEYMFSTMGTPGERMPKEREPTLR